MKNSQSQHTHTIIFLFITMDIARVLYYFGDALLQYQENKKNTHVPSNDFSYTVSLSTGNATNEQAGLEEEMRSRLVIPDDKAAAEACTDEEYLQCLAKNYTALFIGATYGFVAEVQILFCLLFLPCISENAHPLRTSTHPKCPKRCIQLLLSFEYRRMFAALVFDHWGCQLASIFDAKILDILYQNER
jgi:hypothetical protein